MHGSLNVRFYFWLVIIAYKPCVVFGYHYVSQLIVEQARGYTGIGNSG